MTTSTKKMIKTEANNISCPVCNANVGVWERMLHETIVTCARGHYVSVVISNDGEDVGAEKVKAFQPSKKDLRKAVMAPSDVDIRRAVRDAGNISFATGMIKGEPVIICKYQPLRMDVIGVGWTSVFLY